jgi:hypothetical protein
MLKKNLVFAFFLFSNLLFSQSETLKIYADSLINDLNSENYQSFTRRLYTPIVEMGGGLDSYTSYIKSLKEAFKKSGFKTLSYEFITNSEVVKANDELHTIVSYKHNLEMSDNHFQGKVNFLAISKDEGKTWVFVDLETFDLPSIKDFIPHYNDALPYPEIEFPIQIEKEKK